MCLVAKSDVELLDIHGWQMTDSGLIPVLMTQAAASLLHSLLNELYASAKRLNVQQEIEKQVWT